MRVSLNGREVQSSAILSVAAALTALAMLTAACLSLDRQNGSQCVKDSDCASTNCNSGTCAPLPPVLEDAGGIVQPIVDAGGGGDSGGTPDASDGGGGGVDASGGDSGSNGDSGNSGDADSTD